MPNGKNNTKTIYGSLSLIRIIRAKAIIIEMIPGRIKLILGL